MRKLRVHSFSLSLDGYAAGPRQTREDDSAAAHEAIEFTSSPSVAHVRLVRHTPTAGGSGKL
jgi:hypothetical protein